MRKSLSPFCKKKWQQAAHWITSSVKKMREKQMLSPLCWAAPMSTKPAEKSCDKRLIMLDCQRWQSREGVNVHESLATDHHVKKNQHNCSFDFGFRVVHLECPDAWPMSSALLSLIKGPSWQITVRFPLLRIINHKTKQCFPTCTSFHVPHVWLA